MAKDVLVKNYFEVCMNRASTLHKLMKRQGLYNGQKVKVGGITVAIPTQYFTDIYCALEQLQLKHGTMMATGLMKELLLAVNGVNGADEIFITPDEVALLIEGPDALKNKGSGLKKERLQESATKT
jgi:hypothetical protein